MASELRVNTLKDASGNNSIGHVYCCNGSAKKVLCRTIAGRYAINITSLITSLTDKADGDCVHLRHHLNEMTVISCKVMPNSKHILVT